MKRTFFLLVLLMCLAGCPLAQADCTASSSSGSFGTLSSFAVNSTAQSVQTGSGFTCSGSALSLLSTNTVTATLSTSANAASGVPRLYNAASGTYIPYTVCTDTTCSSILTGGGSYTWSSTTLLGLLGLFNASNGTLPLYLKSTPGVNVPAGTYTDTLTLNWNYHICFVGLLGLCVYTDGTGTSAVQLSMVVQNDCSIDAVPDVDFGSAALPSGFSRLTSALGIRCTLNAAYTVDLSSAQASSAGWRQMAASTAAGTSLLQYRIYQPGGLTWVAGSPLSQTGTGSTQSLSYSAEINPDQRNQPAGRYSDTVTLTVSY
ncbi:Csu type fimbrial protein [Pantoea ananatis]|uniref:Csu type fimbrial protein n=1 Tax=Pantoea ananas TaxID=553 RepID=UPI003FA4B6BD